jgi:hypothetical protein
MKVKIKNKIYDSEKEPIMLIFKNDERRVSNMSEKSRTQLISEKREYEIMGQYLTYIITIEHSKWYIDFKDRNNIHIERGEGIDNMYYELKEIENKAELYFMEFRGLTKS